MKNLYIALSFTAISITLSAQNKSTQTADKLFERFEYVDAAKEYLKIVEKGKATEYVYRQLADSYFYVFNPTEAVKWYAKATQMSQDAETYYRYAQMLKATGKYEEANKQMQKFANAAPNDSRAIEFRKNPDYLPKLLSKVKQYNVNSLEISSDKSDFGAVLYDNSLYFASARGGAKSSGWNEEPYFDIYKADYNTDGTITNINAFTELNSKWHDGPMTLSTDGKTLFFASESFREKKAYEQSKDKKTKTGQLYLYKAVKSEDNKWRDIVVLPFNDKSYTNSNPSLSRDGKTLYFSSNRPGGLGGVDIWKAAVNADGTYGTPENLGPKVNTEGNESFPFIADDNKTLYFSSTGRQGFGGLDVYQVDLSGGSEAVNMGKPVNTEKDDFSFTFNEGKKIGFLASNRNGNDDIFGAVPVCGVDALAIVTDAKTGAILANASVSVLDEKKNIVGTETANAKGEVHFNLECDRPYVLQATKEGYDSNTFAVNKTREPKVTVNAELQPIEVIITETEVILAPIYFEFNKSNITQEGAVELNKLVDVMKKNEKMVIFVKSHTDSKGSDQYNLNLSERRAQSTVQYVISKGIDAKRISGKGMGELEPKIPCGDKCTEDENALNRRSEFLIVK